MKYCHSQVVGIFMYIIMLTEWMIRAHFHVGSKFWSVWLLLSQRGIKWQHYSRAILCHKTLAEALEKNIRSKQHIDDVETK